MVRFPYFDLPILAELEIPNLAALAAFFSSMFVIVRPNLSALDFAFSASPIGVVVSLLLVSFKIELDSSGAGPSTRKVKRIIRDRQHPR